MWTYTRLSFDLDTREPATELVWASTLRQLRSVDFGRNVRPWLSSWDRVVITRPNGTIHSIII